MIRIVTAIFASYIIGAIPFSLIAPCPLIHKLRLFKESWELERMREAAKISAKAHELAREVVVPGMNERQLQGLIEQCFLENGARRSRNAMGYLLELWDSIKNQK